MVVDYTKGKIYQIVSSQTNEVYVGSTCETLSVRMAKHRCACKRYQKGMEEYVSSYELIRYDDARIELLSDFPCERREQLLAEEGKYIKQLGALNRCVAGRTKKQYYTDNCDKIREQQRQYYAVNNDKILEQRKQYYADNTDKIREQKKQYRIQTNTCECGGRYTNANKTQHMNTKKHKLFLCL